MTEEETKNETVKIELSCFALDTIKAIKAIRKDELAQNITFKYDKFTKGRNVAMTLTSNKNQIDAPDLDIYIEYDQLESILEFLLKQKK